MNFKNIDIDQKEIKRPENDFIAPVAGNGRMTEFYSLNLIATGANF
jgi:hypothetical protein